MEQSSTPSTMTAPTSRRKTSTRRCCRTMAPGARQRSCGTEQEREQNVTVPLSSLLYLSGSQELRSYYDAAMTQEYQTPEIEWPDGGSTTVYVKSGDQD